VELLFGELQQKNNNVEQRKYSDKKYVLNKIAQIIKTNPLLIASILKDSNVFIENPYDKRELVEKVAYNLAYNVSFPKKIGLVLGNNEVNKELLKVNDLEFSNLGGYGKVDKKGEAGKFIKTLGSSTASGAQSGGWVGAIIGAIAGAVDASFGAGSAKKKAKKDEEKYRQELLLEVFEEPKKNWTPIIIVGSVLLISAVVILLVFKNKK